MGRDESTSSRKEEAGWELYVYGKGEIIRYSDETKLLNNNLLSCIRPCGRVPLSVRFCTPAILKV